MVLGRAYDGRGHRSSKYSAQLKRLLWQKTLAEGLPAGPSGDMVGQLVRDQKVKVFGLEDFD
jgi:hypothetical protein